MKKIRILKILCLVFAAITEVILFIPETVDLEILGEYSHCLADYTIGFIAAMVVIPYIVFECFSIPKSRFEKKTATVLAKSFLPGYASFVFLASIKEAGNFGSVIGALGFIMSVILFVLAGLSFGIDLKYLKEKQN